MRIVEGRGPDGTWRVLTTREHIERLVDEGYTPEDVLDAFGDVGAVVLVGEDLYLTPPGRRKLLAVVRQIHHERRPARRPRLIPDAENAIRDAVAALVETRTRLSWRTVTTWLRSNVQGCESVDEKTLRGWRDEDGLPRLLTDPRYRAPR